MSENPHQIQPGDIFVKRLNTGDEFVLLMLPPRPNSAKQWYRRLHRPGMSIDSAWWRSRRGIGNPHSTVPWRYVGTVPAWFIEELMK